MTSIEDPASDAINAFIRAMKKAFDPNDPVFPPLGGGSETVRFIAGSVVALSYWDAHAAGTDCQQPFLWVRLVRRFRSRTFPSPTVDIDNCGLAEVIVVEIGVGRCAALAQRDGTVDWDDIKLESEVSLDDSRRISLAMCLAKRYLADNAVGVDTIVPSGPDGGVIAWAGTAFVQL